MNNPTDLTADEIHANCHLSLSSAEIYAAGVAKDKASGDYTPPKMPPSHHMEHGGIKPNEEPPPAWIRPNPITSEEWETARLKPDCIVERYLYADVGVLVAAGGTGKTTLILKEAIHIVLELDLYGRKIEKTGKVLIMTAEDKRDLLIARLREICVAMDLTPEQISKVRAMIEISDVTGRVFRLTEVKRDVIETSRNVDVLIDQLLEDPPVLIIIDPLVSFGTGESRVNDAEQGLVMAARRIVKALGCCVRYVHHTGQVAAREKLEDAYASRGGTALPDGCRMVAVLVNCDDKDTPPPQLDDGQVMKMALPKISYCKKQRPIWLSRDRYYFDFANEPPPISPEAAAKAKVGQIERYLLSQLKDGNYHSKTTLADCVSDIGMTRNDARKAISKLISSGKVIDKDLPADKKHGARKTFLCPSHYADKLAQ